MQLDRTWSVTPVHAMPAGQLRDFAELRARHVPQTLALFGQEEGGEEKRDPDRWLG